MSTHWCYRCDRLVRVWRQDLVCCPDCDSGFLEQIEPPMPSLHVDTHHRRDIPAYMNSRHHHHRRHRRNINNDRSPFNPVIMLPGNNARPSSYEGPSREGEETNNRHGFELFYNDGSLSGSDSVLRPLPSSMHEFLLGSEFDRVLEQLLRIENNNNNNNNNGERNEEEHHHNHRPATKASVDSLPEVEIDHNHLIKDSHCAICKEAFHLGHAAREMPCKHIYHSECISPWLQISNSCPVCRQELPSIDDQTENINARDEENVGLTIWRLPGGGYAVGRFYGGRRGDEREFPLVYAEMDGGGEPRRLSMSSSRGGGERNSGGLRRMFGNLFGCLRGSGGGGITIQRSNSTIVDTLPLRSSSGASTPSHRPRRSWSMDVNSGTRPL
ncbi:hypothetical protein RIF29_17435 [Crotalaria pallida]|uniref:RING-type E3 ubiquitin transferase n=1 Tax=Crotalaria pallida TaxID=3830 RepID=A0AAN9IKE1_CROPI